MSKIQPNSFLTQIGLNLKRQTHNIVKMSAVATCMMCSYVDDGYIEGILAFSALANA